MHTSVVMGLSEIAQCYVDKIAALYAIISWMHGKAAVGNSLTSANCWHRAPEPGCRRRGSMEHGRDFERH
jgi:hypothetical protein